MHACMYVSAPEGINTTVRSFINKALKYKADLNLKINLYIAMFCYAFLSNESLFM